MTTYEYVTNPKTGKVHVADDGPTLCGQAIERGWVRGAETVSALDATCARCRQIARSKARRIE